MKSAATLTVILALALVTTAVLAQAQGKGRTGEEIVKTQCSRCHQEGLHGAPRIDDRAAWAPRMKEGLDAAVNSAIKGHGAMPARGGLVDLTDAELRAAILYLFNPAGMPQKPRVPPPANNPNQKIVAGIQIDLGVISARSIRARPSLTDAERNMHGGIPEGNDYYHVNVTLRDSVTQALVGDAQVEVKVTNPVMGSETGMLERIEIGGVVSYGGYFRITGKEPHTIAARVQLPKNARVIEARFRFSI